MQSSCLGLHFVVAPRLCTTKNDQNSQMQLWGCHITWMLMLVKVVAMLDFMVRCLF